MLRDDALGRRRLTVVRGLPGRAGRRSRPEVNRPGMRASSPAGAVRTRDTLRWGAGAAGAASTATGGGLETGTGAGRSTGPGLGTGTGATADLATGSGLETGPDTGLAAAAGPEPIFLPKSTFCERWNTSVSPKLSGTDWNRL